jgi:hypothetical protein
MNYVMRQGRRIEVEVIDSGHTARKRRKPFEPVWVKLPRHWFTALQRTHSVNTYRLALVILWEGFKRKHTGGKIVLSAEVTGQMPRCTKIRAARELAGLGLIQIKQDGNRALVEEEGPCVSPAQRF